MEDENPPPSDVDTSIDEFEDTRSHLDPTKDLHGDLSLDEEDIILPPPILDDPNPNPADPVVPPAHLPHYIPVDPPSIVHNPPAVIMAEGGEADPMATFKKAIVEAFQEANRNSTYPMPTFAGKKGDKPEDHTLWFDDYVQHYHITAGQKAQAFVKTLTGKARAWADTTKGPDRLLSAYQAADGAPRAEVERTLKHLFLT